MAVKTISYAASDIGKHRVDPDEFTFGIHGNDLRQRGFSTARRTVKNKAAKIVRPDQSGQQAGFAHDMILPDDLV